MGMILTACATMPVPMAMSMVVIIAVVVIVALVVIVAVVVISAVVVACRGHRRFPRLPLVVDPIEHTNGRSPKVERAGL